ncbi:MAG: molybdopterin-dependent oxidoreductase, partial [Vicinamibacterales bacterium]
LKQFGPLTAGVTFSWRYREKPQPANTKFPIPAVDAPNLRGATDLGFKMAPIDGPADVTALRTAVEAGVVKVLFVLDPGPEGSIGETDWIVAARHAGKITTLIVQGVLKTALAEAADILLPGCAFVEKDATFTNITGHVQSASRVITPPGDAAEDWQILSKIAVALGATIAESTASAIRQSIATSLSTLPGYSALTDIAFARPVSARQDLQSSNPSERGKWDTMFQDLPPVKFGDEFGPLERADVFPLRLVE